MKWMNMPAVAYDWVNGTIRSRIEKPYSKLYYIVESADWVIRRVGTYITKNLENQKLLNAKITVSHEHVRSQVLHFGSINTFLTAKGFHIPHESNKVVVTWFHVIPDDTRVRFVREAQKYIDLFHTSCVITREKLIEIGIPEEKIVVVPLGVDLNLFKPVSLEEKQKIRKELGLTKNKVAIGSFQKDGAGWGEGLEPKLIKGPDIFVKVIDTLKENHDIIVLLTGPARGYVKRELDRIGVPYKHSFLKDYTEMPKYYAALDLYLVASREEGGPEAMLEAMAAGVPVVSTKVGMAPDIINEDYNGLLAEAEDVATLSQQCAKILRDGSLTNYLVNNALKEISGYSWENISSLYHDKIYRKLLRKRS